MTQVDSLLLDAKQAILEEHHRRFESFRQEGRWPEAVQQLQTTLWCAADLLHESLQLLDDTLKTHGHVELPADPSSSVE